MDFTAVRQPIHGCCPYVLAVRDLASGLQFAWQPVPDRSAAALLPELSLLFTVYGAPLVLKSDNGAAFRAAPLKALVARWRVWMLFSPPGAPWYNGATEASIGSLKTRTQFHAWCAGHADGWASADLEQAREVANTTARPRGPRGPTPAQAWAGRAHGTSLGRWCGSWKPPPAVRRASTWKLRWIMTTRPRCIGEYFKKRSCKTVIFR